MRAGQRATYSHQMANLRRTCTHLARMISNGYDMVVTHGNGPQVGNILLQNELSKNDIPVMPMDVCVAESQGLLGYMIQQALTEALEKNDMEKVVACMLTMVMVDADDPAFDNPTKPVGPYYSAKEAEQLQREEGWTMIEDIERGGYRRAIPSPRPVDIVESEAIQRLVFGGKDQTEIVVACGGGGIPVIRRGDRLMGVEAVVDKDLAACVLACSIDEKLLILLTDIDCVYLNFGTEEASPIREAGVGEMEEYLEEGHFPSGTMGPKVEAAIHFLRNGGEKTIITSPESLDQALEGEAGTHIAYQG